MTPKEFQILEREQAKIIDDAQSKIKSARINVAKHALDEARKMSMGVIHEAEEERKRIREEEARRSVNLSKVSGSIWCPQIWN